MPTRDSGGQQKARKNEQDDVAEDAQASSDVAERKEKLDDDIDSILDEIDETLEENSEDFVRQFVQKGGE